jgi:hypothetical protein
MDPMRTMTLLLCLALAGCAGANAAYPVADTSPRPSGAAADAQARGTSPADSQNDWWKEGGVTREKINAMCWMKYEKGRADLPLEKRADLVNACVQQALKEHPLS